MFACVVVSLFIPLTLLSVIPSLCLWFQIELHDSLDSSSLNDCVFLKANINLSRLSLRDLCGKEHRISACEVLDLPPLLSSQLKRISGPDLLTNPEKEKINLLSSSLLSREAANQSESATKSHQKSWPIRPTLLHGLVGKDGIDWKGWGSGSTPFPSWTVFPLPEVRGLFPKSYVKKIPRPFANVLLNNLFTAHSHTPVHFL